MTLTVYDLANPSQTGTVTKVVGTTSYSVLPAGAVQSGFVGIQQVVVQSAQIISAETGVKTLSNAPITVTRESNSGQAGSNL